MHVLAGIASCCHSDNLSVSKSVSNEAVQYRLARGMTCLSLERNARYPAARRRLLSSYQRNTSCMRYHSPGMILYIFAVQTIKLTLHWPRPQKCDPLFQPVGALSRRKSGSGTGAIEPICASTSYGMKRSLLVNCAITDVVRMIFAHGA